MSPTRLWTAGTSPPAVPRDDAYHRHIHFRSRIRRTMLYPKSLRTEGVDWHFGSGSARRRCSPFPLEVPDCWCLRYEERAGASGVGCNGPHSTWASPFDELPRLNHDVLVELGCPICTPGGQPKTTAAKPLWAYHLEVTCTHSGFPKFSEVSFSHPISLGSQMTGCIWSEHQGLKGLSPDVPMDRSHANSLGYWP